MQSTNVEIQETGYLVFENGFNGGWFTTSREEAEKWAKSARKNTGVGFIVVAEAFATSPERFPRRPGA